MFRLYKLVLLLAFLTLKPAFSQSIEGLKDIVSFQQEKISRIEDNLKQLIGSIEKQSNLNLSSKKISTIEEKINSINQKLLLLENNVKNLTNLSYNLDFALKRLERHLELSSINGKIEKKLENPKSTELSFKNDKIANINKKSLEPKTDGVLGFVKEQSNNNKKNNNLPDNDKTSNPKAKFSLPEGSAEENFNYALDLARQLNFSKAEMAFKDFLIIHKDTNKRADAQYWLGRVYFAQKKFEEAAIALAEFNSIFPNDSRFQETTLLIAESAVNFAPKDQLCDILNQSIEFMINPTDKFIKRINILKNEKKCPSE